MHRRTLSVLVFTSTFLGNLCNAKLDKRGVVDVEPDPAPTSGTLEGPDPYATWGDINPDPYDDPDVTTDAGCKAAGAGRKCRYAHPGDPDNRYPGIQHGRCCYGSDGGPQYLWCKSRGWSRWARWEEAWCVTGECIQVDSKNDFMVCAETA
jgi:hypothetical protein